MKKLFAVLLAAVSLSTVQLFHCSTAHALDCPAGKLCNDGIGVTQAFVPDPAKAQVPINLAGSKVFRKGAGGDYDITGWTAINVIPSSANLTRYYNSDSTKTRPVFSAQDNIIVIHPNTTQITISGTDASVSIEGM